MTPRVVAKSKRPEAERAAEWAMHLVLGCTHTRRALRTPFNKVDLFGADAIGIRPDGSKCFVQVTAGQSSAVTARRRKLERYPWAVDDYVAIWQLVEAPASGRGKDWRFDVHVYRCTSGTWSWTHDPGFDIDKSWFKAMPKEDTGGYDES